MNRLILLLLLSIPFVSFSQTVSSGLGTLWNDPLSWTPNIVPTSTNTTSITINHAITVTANVTIDQTTIGALGSIFVDPLITLTINNGTGTDLTITGGLIVNGTLTNTGTAALTIVNNGTNFVNNGTINLTSGTLTLGGTSITTLSDPSSTTVSALTLSTTTGASLIANSALTITGVLTINAGASITAGATSTVTKGAGNFVGTGSFVSTGATIFNGTSTVSGAGLKTFNNLTVNATFTMTPNAAYTVNGNINVAGTLAAGTNTATFGGTTTISGAGATTFNNVVISGTLTLPATTVRVNGNLTNNGIFNHGSGTLQFGGTTVITNTTTLNLNNVSFNAGANSMTAPAGNMGIAGNFTSIGTFNNGGGTIVFNGSGTSILSDVETYNNVTVNSLATIQSAFGQTINGTFNNNGSVNFTAGTLTLGGTSVTTLANPSSTTVSALTLNTTTGATIAANSALTITGVLTINAGASITASSTSTVTKGAGNFVGTGSYISTGTTTFSGASTLSGAGQKTFNDLIVNATVTPNVSYTVTGDISGTGTLAAGTGVATFNATDGTILISGTGPKNFFDVTINLGTTVTYSTNVTVSGANLIGNGNLSTDVSAPLLTTITFTTLTLSGTGTKDFTNVTIGAGASTIPNADYTISRDLVITGTLAAGSGLTTFAGTTVISGAGVSTFNNVTVNLGANVSGVSLGTINGIFDNNGTVNFTSGTLNLGAASATDLTSSTSTTFNALTTVLGATITDAPGTTLTITGNFVGGADYTSLGTTTFDGTVAMSGAGTKTFNNLIVNGTSLTPAANISYTVTGSISGTGLLNDGSGTSSTTFSGTTIPITGSGVKDFFDIIINGGTSVTYISSISVNGATLVGTGNLASASPTSTITFTSVAISGAGTRDFANVTIATGASTISGAYSIAGNPTTLTMTGSLVSSGVPTFNGATTIVGVGALTFSSDINITSSNSLTLGSGTVTVNGNINNSGTINPGSGTLAFSGTSIITNTGTMNLNNVTLNSASTVTAPSTVMGIAGVFTFTGGGTPAVFNHGGGTIEFNTANAVASRLGGTAAKVFNDIQATGTFNNTQDFTVIDIDVTVTGTFTNNGAITVNGNISNSGTINCTAAAVTWGVSGALSGTGTPTTTFFNLIVAASQTLSISTFPVASPITISSDLTLTGNLNHTALNTIIIGDDQLGATGTLTSSGIIQFNGAASAFTVGGTKTFTNLSVGGAGVLSVGAASSFSIDGILNVAGTLNAGTGVSVTTFGNGFAGTTPSITGAGTINLDDVVIAGGHTLTSASGTVQITGNLTITGSFVHNSGTVLFRTVGPNNITGTPSTFFNITVGNGAGNTTVTNSLTPLSLAGRLNMNGTATNVFNTGGASNFILLSTTDNPTTDGSIGILTNGFSSISGAMTVQRHMDSESRIYRYIASPVVGATVADLQAAFPVSGTFTDPSACPLCPGSPVYNPASPSLNFYNETTQAYVAYPSSGLASAAALTNGIGYSAFVRQDGIAGPATINFPGTHPSTAGLSLPVASAANGFSLVGNPYPSAILWDPAGAGYTGTANIVTTVKVRNNGGGGGFVDVLPGQTIAAGQAFWVTTSAGGGGVLNINENAKTTSSSIFYKVEGEINDEIEINLSKASTGFIDITRVIIQDGSLLNLDNFDAKKSNNAMEGVANQFDLSTLTSDNISLSTNFLPSVGCTQQINLKVADLLFSPTGTTEASAEYTFNFNPSGAMQSLIWTLHDNHLNTDVNISSSPTYTFTVDNSIASSKAPTRFYIKASSILINETLPITSPNQVCESSSASIAVVGSQLNMMYGVEVNGTFYPNVAQGTGSDLNVPLKSEWLNVTTNTIKVKVNSGCDAQFLTATAQITKESLYTAIPVAVQSCIAGAVTLAASGALATTNYKWYDSQTSSTPLATGYQFVTPALSDNTTYYVSAFNSLGCEGARVAITANISDAGALVSVVPSATSVCRNSTITFNATSSLSGTFKWYESLTSTSILSTSDQFTTPQLLKTKKYYVSFVNANGCEGGRIEALAQISNFTPVLSWDTGLGTKTICTNGSYTFTANGAPVSSEYAWFDSEDSTTPLLVANEFTTPALSATRIYYLAAKNELGCYTEREKIEAVVDLTDPSTGITFTGDNACLNNNAVIKLSHASAGTTYNWYESETSTDRISSGAEYATDFLTESKSFYAAAVNANGCEGTRKPIEVKVSNFNQTLLVDRGIGEKQVCPQGSYTFTASGALSGASYAWFDSQESITPLRETATFTTPALSESMSYYLAAKNALGCYSSNRIKVEALVDVEDPSSGIAAIAETTCKNGRANIIVNDGLLNTTYKWYDSQTSTTKIGEGKLYKTEDLIDSKTYYVSAVNKNGCEGSRTEAMVEVTSFEDASISQVSDEVLESSYEEGNQWYFNDILLTGENKQTLTVSESGNYAVKVSVNGCTASAAPFKVELVTGFDDPTKTISVYPNPASEVVSIRFVGNEDVNVSFIDQRGVILAPVKLQQEGRVRVGELDVRSFSRGLYFIRIYSETRSITHKVIIK